ncbi:MAG TPA: hypothetical protein VK203_02340 [Nostocaceae cyanobacterium]|nr:hypothetical protein [Nostocaceae cyanobacterium]
MKTRMPIQSAPVERTTTGAAISNQNGVEASILLDILKTVDSVPSNLFSNVSDPVG